MMLRALSGFAMSIPVMGHAIDALQPAPVPIFRFF
jgi:hypothetical protein